MKVLGYVNRFSRGVYRVQKELLENGNGEAAFDFSLVTAFRVVENASQKYFELGFSDTPQVINNATENNIGKDFGKDFNINEMQKKILAIMRQNPEITTDRIAESIGITRRHIEANIRQLKALGALERIGGRKNGNWAVKI